MHRSLAIASLAFAAALLLAACGGSSKPSPTSSPDDRASYQWSDKDVRSITFKGKSATAAQGVKVEEGTVTIREPGTYRIQGQANPARILVDLQQREGTVGLILAGIDLTNPSGPALEVDDATHVHIVLAAGSTNTLADGTGYPAPDPQETAPNAAIFSKRDLTISGTGSLTVRANHRDAITSRDTLHIAGGALSVFAPDDGLLGRDALTISGGTITVLSTGDALKSANGGITVSGGTITATAEAGDAVDAGADVTVSGGTLRLKTGRGASAGPPAEGSLRGIKAAGAITLSTATLELDTSDDGLHARSVRINSGQLTIASGDDGITADDAITIQDGTLTITRAFEGLEATDIAIKGGSISITAENDGLNNPFPSVFGSTAQPQSGTIAISGGTLVINTEGDGIDAGLRLSVSGGTVVVHGPAATANSPVDFSSGFDFTGGVVLLLGRELKSRPPQTGQPGLAVTFASPAAAGTVIHIVADGAFKGMTFRSAKPFQSFMLAAPGMTLGQTLGISSGGEVTGTEVGGLYISGSYTGGKVRGTASPVLQ